MPPSTAAVLQEARAHQQAKRLDAAELGYKQLLQLDPTHAEALYRLGQMEFERGQWDMASEYLRLALKQEPKNTHILSLLGMVQMNRRDYDDAETCFRGAIQIAPNLADAHSRLGQVRQQKEDWDEALAAYRRAVALDPKNPRYRNNLGCALRAKERYAEAVGEFKQAIALKPGYLHARNNLGEALWLDGQIVPAQQIYQETMRLAPQDFQVHHNYGSVMLALSRPDKATPLLQRAADLHPTHLHTQLQLAFAFSLQGRSEDARAAYAKVLASEPDNLTAMFASRLMLPPIYRDRMHIAEARARYETGLSELETIAANYSGPAHHIFGLTWGNFYLAYQGLDDTKSQRRYAAIIETLLRRELPQFFEPVPIARRSGRRVRIGFASSFLRYCTAGLYFKSWVTKLDAARFEIYYYNLSPLRDAVVKEVASHAAHTVHVPIVLATMVEQIKADRLDVLVFPEVGMDYVGSLLPVFRLAPVQCAGWGHPVTTGRLNVDYFLSVGMMEPADAASHYSEKLVLLDGIGTSYPRPSPPQDKSRVDFKLPEDRTLYLNPQSLHKIHPDHDALMADILHRDSRGALVFFEAYEPTLNARFKARLEGTLQKQDIPMDRLIFLPRMGHDEYRQVNRLCDVMLDTPHWSGGNTSLDAIASSLPIVTLPGRFMRGRQSQGMLRLLGLESCIADDAQDYVRIALDLGADKGTRQRISQRMRDNAGIIFDKPDAIRQIENFLLSAIP